MYDVRRNSDLIFFQKKCVHLVYNEHLQSNKKNASIPVWKMVKKMNKKFTEEIQGTNKYMIFSLIFTVNWTNANTVFHPSIWQRLQTIAFGFYSGYVEIDTHVLLIKVKMVTTFLENDLMIMSKETLKHRDSIYAQKHLFQHVYCSVFKSNCTSSNRKTIIIIMV